MGIWARLPFSFRVSMNFVFGMYFLSFRIYAYATASTNSAAYIIGGWGPDGMISTIGQYKNNKWLNIGDLKEKKSSLSATFHNGEYLIVGGTTGDGGLVN